MRRANQNELKDGQGAEEHPTGSSLAFQPPSRPISSGGIEIMEKKIVYKLVGKTQRGNFISIAVSPPWTRRYAIGKPTYPRTGAVFAFSTLDAAENWRLANQLILRCEALGGTFIPESQARVPSLKRFYTAFWKEIFQCRHNDPDIVSRSDSWPIPEGTILCEAVIPVEVVQ